MFRNCGNWQGNRQIMLKVKNILTFFHFPERCRIRQTFYNIMPCEGVPWSSLYWLSDRLEWKIWHVACTYKSNQFLYEYFPIQCLSFVLTFFFHHKKSPGSWTGNLLSVFCFFDFLRIVIIFHFTKITKAYKYQLHQNYELWWTFQNLFLVAF